MIVSSIFIFISGLLLGRWAYALSLIYEGRRCISIYTCSSCRKWNGLIISIYGLFSRGYCSRCKKKLDMNAILMELSIASLFLLSFLTFPKQWLALEISLFILMSMIALMVDIKRTILPDTLTLGGIAVALVGALLNPERSLVDSAIGLFTGGALLAIPSYLFYIVKKVEGIGGGDIKMLAWVGALIGAKAVFNVLLVSCIIGTLSGLILYYVKKREGRFVEMELAFGPYIAISTYVYALFDSIYFF